MTAAEMNQNKSRKAAAIYYHSTDFIISRRSILPVP